MDKLNLSQYSINASICIPKNGSGPGVLVLHAWWGLNNFIEHFCEKLANEGFFVVAPDMYDGKIASTIKEAEQYVQQVDDKLTSKLLAETVDFMLKNDNCTSSQLAVIGFSYGAAWSGYLSNNKPNEINKVILFYGTGEANFTKAKASFLCHFASDDPYEDPEYIKQFIQSIKSNNLKVTDYTYPDTYHWFFESDNPEHFKKKASELAWKRTLNFLKEN